MPRFLPAVLILLLLHSRNLPAQSDQAPKNTNGNTYALIVGISSYELNGIPRLDFAHRDAQEFARFLRSPNGGNVPEDNIRLLLNEQANYASIYNSLYWLLDTCRKNDIVYFYFSGHGDVENNTIYKLGFLLAANTPRFNYINSAVRIEDVNNIANTISVQKGARVVIITDACRSGNLAGKENKGNLLVGEQLRMASGNEVRITSCGPEELSNEDEGWAGGRGVFSYYLVKGLEGLADYSRDKIVTLNELKQYLKNSILTDPLMAQKEHKQNPVLTGPEGIKLAEIKSSPSQSMVQMAPAPVAEGGAGPSALGLSPQGFFLSLTKGKKLEDLVDFNELSEMNQAEIPFRFIDSVVSKLELKEASEKARIEKLLLSLRQNKDALQRFT
ncbi:MAG TPA: caspase family protein, partial [Chitinophagaceae bacterium]|nr:caspase family protein [Chitinophagaceae bacterium]